VLPDTHSLCTRGAHLVLCWMVVAAEQLAPVHDSRPPGYCIATAAVIHFSALATHTSVVVLCRVLAQWVLVTR
jgi:hypothetical protein